VLWHSLPTTRHLSLAGHPRIVLEILVVCSW
jgi:hypothetical protein